MTLNEFFEQHNRVALAFSGGTDSAFLLYEAVKANCDVCAYYVKSEFQPRFEYDDAMRLVNELGAKIKVIELSVLHDEMVAQNSALRCYYCKNRIFSTITAAARADGYSEIIDGTNASDDSSDRPGMKALEELSVLSPLRECGYTKDQIRTLSKEAGLFTWNKPAYACLATRIKTGQVISAQDLIATEISESYLAELGFTDFRVRRVGNTAKIQLKESQFDLALSKRPEITDKLKNYYDSITLDLEAR